MSTHINVTHWKSHLVHQVATFSAIPYLAFFYPYYCIPIPFEDILSEEEFKCFRKLCHFCATCVQIRVGHCINVKGYENLYLFCHCHNPHSLQCRASTQWILQVIKSYFEGFSWNLALKDYHMLCNYHGSTHCHVICSCFYNGIHYIYVKVFPNAFYGLRDVLATMSRYYTDFDDSFAVIVCRNCKKQCECCLRRCAKRIGTILTRGNITREKIPYERKQFLNKYATLYNAILNMYFDGTYIYTGLFK